MFVRNAATDVTTYFVLRDSTNHAPKTDVVVTDIDLYYVEELAAMAAKVDCAALVAANSAHADNSGFHVGLGMYRIDWPDACFDGGIGKKVQLIVVCTGVDTTFLEVELSPPADAVALSGDATAADNLELACDGGAYNVGGGAVVAASVSGAVASVTGAVGSVTGAVGSVTAGVTLGNVAHGGAAATLTLSGAAGIVATKLDAPINGAIVGNITGNLSGSVGSVGVGGIAAASFAAGAIDAAAIAAGAIDNATFAADVGSTAYATNIVALAVNKALDNYDPPTNTEMIARTMVTADYATAAALLAVDNFLDTEIADIKAVTDKLDTMIEVI